MQLDGPSAIGLEVNATCGNVAVQNLLRCLKRHATTPDDADTVVACRGLSYGDIGEFSAICLPWEWSMSDDKEVQERKGKPVLGGA